MTFDVTFNVTFASQPLPNTQLMRNTTKIRVIHSRNMSKYWTCISGISLAIKDAFSVCDGDFTFSFKITEKKYIIDNLSHIKLRTQQ